MVQQKDTAIAKQQRRAMAVLLEVDLSGNPLMASELTLAYSKAKRNQHASVLRTSSAPTSIPNYSRSLSYTANSYLLERDCWKPKSAIPVSRKLSNP